MGQRQVTLNCFLDGNALMISNSDFKNIQESTVIFLDFFTPDQLEYIQMMEKRQIELDNSHKLLFTQYDGELMHEKVHELHQLLSETYGEQHCAFCMEVIKPTTKGFFPPKQILLMKRKNLNREMNLASGVIKACLREQKKLVNELLELMH